jgi:hypothetical protein
MLSIHIDAPYASQMAWDRTKRRFFAPFATYTILSIIAVAALFYPNYWELVQRVRDLSIPLRPIELLYVLSVPIVYAYFAVAWLNLYRKAVAYFKETEDQISAYTTRVRLATYEYQSRHPKTWRSGDVAFAKAHHLLDDAQRGKGKKGRAACKRARIDIEDRDDV